MRVADFPRLAARALLRYPARSSLTLLAMAIGVAAVLVLTALGEGARRYVVSEFASLGTHLIIVFPGRSETSGGGPALFAGETPRDLTLADALALEREPLVRSVAPLTLGQASVGWGGREREVSVVGSTADLLRVRHWKMAQGSFLPPGDSDRAANVCVIGAKVRREIFGPNRALGEWLDVGDRRFRVIGVLATQGRSIGLDVQELVVLPVAAAQALFNNPSLFRILVSARSREAMPLAQERVRRVLRERHQGEEDVTVITQDAVLATFDRILRTLTLAVGGIGAISLFVAGILIMNVMLVSVSQRTAEIGLLKALGAPRREIVVLFLTEAASLSLAGAVLGLLIGAAGEALLLRLYPIVPLDTPGWAVAAATTTALVVGLLFGALPARRASRLDPVAALAGH